MNMNPQAPEPEMAPGIQVTLTLAPELWRVLQMFGAMHARSPIELILQAIQDRIVLLSWLLQPSPGQEIAQ